jgi:hypothetical protein
VRGTGGGAGVAASPRIVASDAALRKGLDSE